MAQNYPFKISNGKVFRFVLNFRKNSRFSAQSIHSEPNFDNKKKCIFLSFNVSNMRQKFQDNCNSSLWDTDLRKTSSNENFAAFIKNLFFIVLFMNHNIFCALAIIVYRWNSNVSCGSKVTLKPRCGCTLWNVYWLLLIFAWVAFCYIMYGMWFHSNGCLTVDYSIQKW